MNKFLSIAVFALVDIVCFVQGAAILTYSLLNFSYKVEVVRNEAFTTLEMQNLPVAIGGYYYYSDPYIKIAIIGVSLIVTGFLMRSWRKNFSN